MESDGQMSVEAVPNNQDKTFDYNEVVADLPSSARLHTNATHDHIYFIDDPKKYAHCLDCLKDVRRTTSVLLKDELRCAACFAKVEVGEEEYTVVRSLQTPVIEPSWKASHEIIFLGLLEKFGFGNWRQIREELQFYGGRFSEEELETHYYSCYLSQEDCLPKFANNESFFEKRLEPACTLSKASLANHPTTISSIPAAREEPFEEIDLFYAAHLPRDAAFLDYYNDKRGEFEAEYDQNAELLLANLEFREDDCEEERRIKYRIIEEYNRRLDARNRVKAFVLEHRLLEDNYQRDMDRARNEHERQAFQQLKPLARFTSLQEYNELVRKVAFSKQLKATIEGLRRLRRAHPATYKTLDEFLNSQPEESRPRKRNSNDPGLKTGKKVEEVLEKQFKLSKKDFQNLFQNLQANGKKATLKNVEAVMLEKNY